MARATQRTAPIDQDVLTEIARSVRGSFRTVEDMAQSFIREAIHQGVFRPGERLNLDAIAATLGVSRMPVRASLKQLESEGLVRIHAYRGVTVSVLGPAEIAELYELRTLLEGYLIDHALENLDDEMIARLEAVVADMESTEDLSARLDKRQEFYQLLYEQAGKPRALDLVNHLRGSVGRYLLLQRIDEHRGHESLMDYVRLRDAEGAKRWLAEHLLRVSQRLQEMAADSEAD